MTLHAAGHLKSDRPYSEGRHSVPSKPHLLLASQYVPVHPMNVSGGV